MLMDKATVYEYDRYGMMLGWYHLTDCSRYLPSSEEVIFIEVFAGHGSHRPDLRINPRVIVRDESISWRFYKAPTQRGVVKYDLMEDVTTNLEYISRDDEKLHITLDEDRYQILALSDETFISKSIVLNASTDGVYDFVVTHGDAKEIFPIPLAKFAVRVNGISLIEGIDYFVDFPRVVITAVERLNVTKEVPEVVVTYRAMGFPDSDMKRAKVAEVGFVTDGKLSVNNRYDIHQNKISRIIVDGGVYNPNIFDFGAEYGEAPVPGIPNGRPFLIDRHFISLRGLGGHEEVYQLIEQDRKDNKEVEDYMTKKLVREQPIVTDTVDYKYTLYSPFMSAIAFHLLLEPDRYKRVNYRDPATIEHMVKHFKYLLKCDPAALNLDENRVWIAPTPYAIKERIVVHHRLLKILEAINTLYLNNRIPVHRWFSTTRTRQEDQ